MAKVEKFIKAFLAVAGILGTVVATIVLVQIDISDKTPPKIAIENSVRGEIFAHSQKPFIVKISDESGLERVRVRVVWDEAAGAKNAVGAAAGGGAKNGATGGSAKNMKNSAAGGANSNLADTGAKNDSENSNNPAQNELNPNKIAAQIAQNAAQNHSQNQTANTTKNPAQTAPNSNLAQNPAQKSQPNSLQNPREIVLYDKTFDPEDAPKSLKLDFKLPPNAKNARIEVSATDASGGLLAGNTASAVRQIFADTTPPKIDIIAQSFTAKNGGAVFVVFAAQDEHFTGVYATDNRGRVFHPVRFISEGLYALAVGVAADNGDFALSIVARDAAQNIGEKHLIFSKKSAAFAVKNANLSDYFLNTLVARTAGDVGGTGLEKFAYVNDVLRRQSDERILAANAKDTARAAAGFELEAFAPLKFTAKNDNFAAQTNYFYRQKPVGTARHWGLDLKAASNSQIVASNGGVVSFAGQNGIYGLTVVINHGLGVSSAYTHLAKIAVVEGQRLAAGEVIGTIGRTGFVSSERLGFVVVVGGVFVQPEEFLSAVWVEENIKNVVAAAQRYAQKNKLPPVRESGANSNLSGAGDAGAGDGSAGTGDGDVGAGGAGAKK